MKILFETNRQKIRNIDVYDKALSIIEKESKQGFFRAKGESEFRKFSERSIIEDAKLIELHIVKVEGKGEYKFNGNLSYNQRTKEVKFYILSVVEFDTFRFDEVKMAGFINEPNQHEDEDIRELQAIISKLKKTKPAFVPYKGGGQRGGGSRQGGQRNSGGYKGGSNGGYKDGGNKGYRGKSSDNDNNGKPTGRPNPKRAPLTEAEKEKRSKNIQKKNFRTDQRRNVSNNKKASF